MRKLGFFRALAVRAFFAKVQRIVERNEGLGINLSKLPLHSPERSFSVAWNRRANPEATALLYEGMFVGNDYRYLRNAVEADAGLKRFGEMLKGKDERRRDR